MGATRMFLASWYLAAQPRGWTARTLTSTFMTVQNQPWVLIIPLVWLFYLWVLLEVTMRAVVFPLEFALRRGQMPSRVDPTPDTDTWDPPRWDDTSL